MSALLRYVNALCMFAVPLAENRRTPFEATISRIIGSFSTTVFEPQVAQVRNADYTSRWIPRSGADQTASTKPRLSDNSVGINLLICQ